MSDTTTTTGLPPRFGLLGIAFYAAHATALAVTGEAHAILWSCHLASLLVGAGILAGRPRLVAVAFCWQVLGIPMWFAALRGGMSFYPTSILTHFGGPALALAALRRSGFPGGTAWRASLALVVLWLLTRIVLPSNRNVNLAHDYWFGWEGRVLPYYPYLVVALALATGIFVAVQALARRGLGESDHRSRARKPPGNGGGSVA